VQVKQPAPEGRYIISPASPMPPETRPASPPYTTARGMLPPSIGSSVPQPVAFGPTTSSGQSVDREGPTHGFQPEPSPRSPLYARPLETPGQGRDETRTLRSNEPPSPAPVAFRWPPDLPATRSDQPHVRSLPVPVPVRARTRARAPVVAGVLLMAALALTAVALVFLRPHGVAPASNAAPPGMAITPPPPPVSPPVVALPAPTLAPPAFEEPTAPSASALVASASAPASASAKARAREKAVTAPAVKPAVHLVPVASAPATPASAPSSAAPPASVRPGPGF
jgi:hypothetical protein